MIETLCFIRIAAGLEDLCIDISRVRTAALRNITGHVNILTFFLAGRAKIRWNVQRYGIAALIAFPHYHVSPPYPLCSIINEILMGISERKPRACLYCIEHSILNKKLSCGTFLKTFFSDFPHRSEINRELIFTINTQEVVHKVLIIGGDGAGSRLYSSAGQV
jgi:hypothetical protein